MSAISQLIAQIWKLDLNALDGVSLTAIFVIIVLTTFITEDGACLAAGALAGQGRIGFMFAVTACFVGIVIGDVGLYLIGRGFGNSIAKTSLFRRFVKKESLRNASEWLEKRGVAAIFISRFVAGLRLPTYLAAGFLRTSFPKFLFYFILAGLIWTPLLVGSAAFAQRIISPRYLIVTIIALYVILHLAINLATWKRRRLFLGKLKRIWNWEFWPLWIFYFPVVVYAFCLALKHRSLTVFTCANPAIEAGGFIGESKDEIYRGLSGSGDPRPYLLKHLLISLDSNPADRFELFESWRIKHSLDFPFAIKPDAGERGKRVEIVLTPKRLRFRLEMAAVNLLVQEFAEGPEISVFYYRYPSHSSGRIFSITQKSFPTVTGDGKSSLEKLILRDKRAMCLAGRYFEQNHGRLEDVPEAGEEVSLVNIGTHSRGAIFTDGGEFMTEELEREIDKIVGQYDGFYFGRFDLRAPSYEDLRLGRNLKVVELNGVTSESTNIYDPRYSILDAYAILFRQWKIAFEIGAENASSGCRPASALDLSRMFFKAN